MATRVSSFATLTAPLDGRLQEFQSFFEIQRGWNAIQRQTELHHGDRHFRLNADDNSLGAAQPRGIRDGGKHPRGERIHHVKYGYVDDDAERLEAADLLGDVVAQLHQIAVAQVGLDTGDQHVTLLEDRDRHGLPDLRWLDGRRTVVEAYDLVAELALCFLETALQVVHGPDR